MASERRELRFTTSDVDRFATASHDVNPLHVDPAFARVTPFGGCVVHGALVAIGMLGTLPAAERAGIRALRAWFAGPVVPDAVALVAAERSSKAPDVWELKLTARGKQVARVLAAPDAARIAPGLEPPAPATDAVRWPMRRTPATPSLSTGAVTAGEYSTDDDLVALAPDGLHRTLLDGLAWCSYVVGMEIPGLHSLLSAFTLASDPGPDPGRPAAAFAIELRDHDERTGQLSIRAGLSEASGASLAVARIEAFARTPIEGPDADALGVGAHAPAPARRGTAVVIGASRGFGAALSLALAARGYDVHGTHSAPAGPLSGPVTLHRLDARDAAGMTRLAADIGPIDGVVLNAALSPLSMGLTAEAASDLSAYVATSLELGAVPLGALLAAVTDFVVVCSSSALSAPPRDWPHYVAAKAALEGLASWVAETYPELRTVILRPPAMRTEMTNTPTGRIAPVATETIATWVADRLADGELPAGLTTWEPGTVTAQER